MAPFSRAPLNFTIALFIVVLTTFKRLCRNFFPRCAWRARESIDWTRGTTPTNTPRTLRLVWLSSFSLSSRVTNKSSHCSRCSTSLPPRPRPLPAPTLTRSPFSSPMRVFLHRQGYPRTAHFILFLTSLGFDAYNYQALQGVLTPWVPQAVVCVCDAQSGPAILVITRHSH